ncbi:unnamed protein product [Mucor fragilis]
MLEGLETFANGNRGEQVKWLEIVVLSKGEQSEIVIKVCWDNFEVRDCSKKLHLRVDGMANVIKEKG